MLLRHVIPCDFPPRFSRPAHRPPRPPRLLPPPPHPCLTESLALPVAACLELSQPLLSSPSRSPSPLRAELALLLVFMSTCSSACTSVRHRLHLQQHADGSPLLHKGTASLLCALPHPWHLQPCTPCTPALPASPRTPHSSPQPSSTLLRSGRKYLHVSQQVHVPSSQGISNSASSGAPGAPLFP